MTIVTAATKDYVPWAKSLQEVCKKLGLECCIYALDDEAEEAGPRFVIPEEVQELARVSRSPYKPLLIKRALEDFGDFTVWLDADAFPRARFDEIEEQHYDIGVTIRRDTERGLPYTDNAYYAGYVNAGVIFANPTTETWAFLEKWSNQVAEVKSKSDQEALTRILLEEVDLSNRTGVHQVGDALVGLFPTDIYNFYYWIKHWAETPGDDVKIVHGKGCFNEPGKYEELLHAYGP